MKLALPALLGLAAVAACHKDGKDTPKGNDMPPEPARKPVEMPAAADVAPLATASNALGFDLLPKAAPIGNVAISPASISTALIMTWGGAAGATADEMRKVLHLEGDPAKVLATAGQLAAALQNPKRALVLRIANRLFGEQGYPFEQPFLAQTRDAFGAPLQPLDFSHAPEPARATINSWVEGQTEHRIKDLLPAKSITTDTRLVLVNALYFLADWDQPFEKNQTFDAPFRPTTDAADTRNVPTMHEHGYFKLARADGVAVLELPYKGGDASMVVILPDADDGWVTLVRSLDAAMFAKWRAALAPTEVVVSLPKFTVDPLAAIDLVDTLEQLGMSAAFDPRTADFLAIAKPPDPEKRLFIGAVFHKAFVKVDEKGTEAAAATAVVMPEGAGAAPAPPEVFNADHPFLFAIVDNASGLILFLGRINLPM